MCRCRVFECIAVWCGVLRCVAVCYCGVLLQRFATRASAAAVGGVAAGCAGLVCCSVLQRGAECRSMSQYVVAVCCCSVVLLQLCGAGRLQDVQVSCVAVGCSVVSCSVLQCVAVCCSVVCCSVLQCAAVSCVAVCCSVLQCAAVSCLAVCCSVLQCAAVLCVAVCCSVLQCVATCFGHPKILRPQDAQVPVLSRDGSGVAVCCSVLQCVAVCCSLLQSVAVC